MKEQPPRQEPDHGNRDNAIDPSSNPEAVPRPVHDPAKKSVRKRQEHTPDISIDLTSVDALKKLDEVHALLDSPPEQGESETVTPEDERELAEALSKTDPAGPREMARKAEDIFRWFNEACEQAAEELKLLRGVGYSDADLIRIAEKSASDIQEGLERLNAIRKSVGQGETPRLRKEEIMAIIFDAF